MSDHSAYNDFEKQIEAKSRPVGSTELSWCKGVSCGTGIVVLAIQLSKEPDTSLLQSALHKLQNAHPILQSKLHRNPTTNTFSFTTQPNSHLHLKSFDLSNTSKLLQNLENPSNASLSSFQMILEHELNNNAWTDPSRSSNLIFANVYALPGSEWAVMLRLHGAACDRTTGVWFLRELMGLVEEKVGGGTQGGIENKWEVHLGMEDLIPSGKAKKGLWSHGMDMLGYSMNSFRLTNLKFKDVKWPRSTQVVRLKLTKENTQRLLSVCKLIGIKLCGALAAAGLIAAHSSKRHPNQNPKKYGVLTLTDCRSILEPPLSGHNFGYYHSTILNIHVVKGENLWELATKSYTAFANSKKCNKHFSDLSNLNFLMCKANDNPSLTVSSSQRTSLISVFEDPVIDDSNKMQRQLGVEDCFGCASVHGVGPSIAIFDTIRNGGLNCTCVYPSPLHSREQMQELVDNMKRVLVDGANYYGKEGDI